MIPQYNLPSQILCRVMNLSLSVSSNFYIRFTQSVSSLSLSLSIFFGSFCFKCLQAEPETDEVFAQLTLLPEPEDVKNLLCLLFTVCLLSLFLTFYVDFSEQDLDLIENKEPAEPPQRSVCRFTKILTASDTSTHGGFSVLRKHAEECLPPLVTDTPTHGIYHSIIHSLSRSDSYSACFCRIWVRKSLARSLWLEIFMARIGNSGIYIAVIFMARIGNLSSVLLVPTESFK